MAATRAGALALCLGSEYGETLLTELGPETFKRRERKMNWNQRAIAARIAATVFASIASLARADVACSGLQPGNLPG